MKVTFYLPDQGKRVKLDADPSWILKDLITIVLKKLYPAAVVDNYTAYFQNNQMDLNAAMDEQTITGTKVLLNLDGMAIHILSVGTRVIRPVNPYTKKSYEKFY